jgi:hypothetical protein
MFAISIPIPPVAIAWAIFSVVIGLVALAKGRSAIGWILACLIFSPIVGLVLLFLPDEKRHSRPPSLPKPPSLAWRTLAAVGFRVKQSRAVKVAVHAKGMARRSVDDFTRKTELDREITTTVRRQFPDNR